MKLFFRDDMSKSTRVVSAEYNVARTADIAEGVLLRKTVEILAQKISDDIYDEILSAIDKDTIVREVSLKVSENVLAKIFTPTSEENK